MARILPFQKEYADCQKNAFRSKLVTVNFSAKGERNITGIYNWLLQASQDGINLIIEDSYSLYECSKARILQFTTKG